MSGNKDTVSVTIGSWPMVLAFCLLLVLKLAGVVTWSWWVITAPIWFYPAAICAFITVVLAFIALTMVIALPFLVFEALRK